MTSNLATLNILPINKTVVFSSPIEDKDVLVRTGTISDGSCFFHALLHATSKDYVNMKSDNRISFVEKHRSSMSNDIDKNRWEHLSKGLVAKIPFQEQVNDILLKFYMYVQKGVVCKTKISRKLIHQVIKDNSKDLDTYKLITEMVTLENGFEQTILPTAYKKCNDSVVSKCKNTIINCSKDYYMKEFSKLKGKLSDEKVKYYVNKLELLVKTVVDLSEKYSYNEYIENLRNTSVYVDSYQIGLISDHFNRDVYFIDSKTRMPYRDASQDNIHKRKSILMMWTGGCHYEIIGRLLSDNKIQREFDFDDDIIKKIYTYVCNPSNIPYKYPRLIPYLPSYIRKQLNVDISDSEDERRSDYSDRNNSKRDSSKCDSSECDSSECDSSKRSDKKLTDYESVTGSDISEKDHCSSLSGSDNIENCSDSGSDSDYEPLRESLNSKKYTLY
jgi:hypothetical protein